MTVPVPVTWSGERCDCCDFPVELCTKREEKARRVEALTHRKELMAQGWVLAAYPGKCARCGDPDGYQQRTLIRHYTGPGPEGHQVVGWVAECCATEVPVP